MKYNKMTILINYRYQIRMRQIRIIQIRKNNIKKFILNNKMILTTERYDPFNLIEPFNKRENTVFDEIKNGWVKTLPNSNYGGTSGYWCLDPFENYYYFLEKCCNDKKITIINPSTKLPISTDIYFLTTQGENWGIPTLICNYCFMEENIILGLSLGTGDHGMFSGFLYLIDFNNKKYKTLSHCEYPECYNNEYLTKLFNFKNTLDQNELSNIPLKIKTIYGYYTSPVHQYFNTFTGAYVLNKMNFNKIDELIVGPLDLYKVKLILKEQNNEMIITKKEKIFDLNFLIGKGIFFSYNHFYITNNCSQFFKEKIDKYIPISIDTQKDIENIKKKYNPIFTIHLRGGAHKMSNQDIIISETISGLIKEYPNSFFIFDGYFGVDEEDKNTDLIVSCSNETNGYLVYEYKSIVEKILANINLNTYRSLIDLGINNSLKYSEICDFGIYCNSTYQVILWSCNIPGIFFGRTNIDHFKSIDIVVKEDVAPVDYFTEGVLFVTPDATTEFCSYKINSSTIINKVNSNFRNNKTV